VAVNRVPGALLCVLLLTPLFTGAAEDAYRREDALGLEVRVPMPPSWLAARDGMHALYELHIANLRRHDLRLERIEILDDPSGRALDSLAGERLARATARRGWSGPDERKLQIDGGQHAIVFVELILPTGVPRPSSLKHRVYASAVTGADGGSAASRRWVLETLPVGFGSPPRELAAPLRGPGWLAGNALSNDSDHRRAIIPIKGRATISQRYAIDWVRIGEDGRLAPPGAGDNAAYYGYDEPVYAVADGHVVATKDGIPENVPFAENMAVAVTLETIAGNYVVLDVGGAYAMYAHLRPGSLKVRPGDPVRRGQVLGHVGNSGQSDAPHLHFHVSDTPASLAGEGLPYVLDRFTFRGNVGNVDEWIRSEAPWQPSTPADDQRSGELPLDGDVVDLPR
jgi:murein DD-endopeptidase